MLARTLNAKSCDRNISYSGCVHDIREKNSRSAYMFRAVMQNKMLRQAEQSSGIMVVVFQGAAESMITFDLTVQ